MLLALLPLAAAAHGAVELSLTAPDGQVFEWTVVAPRTGTVALEVLELSPQTSMEVAFSLEAVRDAPRGPDQIEMTVQLYRTSVRDGVARRRLLGAPYLLCRDGVSTRLAPTIGDRVIYDLTITPKLDT